MNKVIVNCETGEQETTPLEGQELADFLATEAEALAKIAAEENAATQKAAEKVALLEKLGISEDEAKLLLG
jgi:hypothetical protein